MVMRKEIVALILEHQGKILVEKRKQSKSTTPGDVIFPAGHVENGETRKQALYREMEEELGIKIYDIQLIHTADFDCEEKQRISWYSCKRWEGKIQTNEAEELLWINSSELYRLTHQVSRDALLVYFRNK
jgi:8-oxo-dGTP diphosphatase